MTDLHKGGLDKIHWIDYKQDINEELASQIINTREDVNNLVTL